MVWIESPDPGDFFTKKNRPHQSMFPQQKRVADLGAALDPSARFHWCVFLLVPLLGSASCDPDQLLKGEFEAVLFLAGVWYIGSSK